MTRPARGKPVGQPLELSDDAVDRAAEVTSVDIASARAVWQQHVSPKVADLLDAIVEPEKGA